MRREGGGQLRVHARSFTRARDCAGFARTKNKPRLSGVCPRLWGRVLVGLDLCAAGLQIVQFALCCLNQIFTTGAESNFGKISSPAIDAKVEEVLDELDPVKARQLANEVDAMLWEEVFSLALFQSPGNVAVRSNLANFGPTGVGSKTCSFAA